MSNKNLTDEILAEVAAATAKDEYKGDRPGYPRLRKVLSRLLTPERCPFTLTEMEVFAVEETERALAGEQRLDLESVEVIITALARASQ